MEGFALGSDTGAVLYKGRALECSNDCRFHTMTIQDDTGLQDHESISNVLMCALHFY